MLLPLVPVTGDCHQPPVTRPSMSDLVNLPSARAPSRQPSSTIPVQPSSSPLTALPRHLCPHYRPSQLSPAPTTFTSSEPSPLPIFPRPSPLPALVALPCNISRTVASYTSTSYILTVYSYSTARTTFSTDASSTLPATTDPSNRPTQPRLCSRSLRVQRSLPARPPRSFP